MAKIRRIAIALAGLALLDGAPARADWGFWQQPTATPVNESISPVVSFRVRDESGAVLPGVRVTLSLCSGPAGAVLSGTTVATTDASGFAYFQVAVDQPGTFLLCADGGGQSDGGVWGFHAISESFAVFETGASTGRMGPQALPLYALGLSSTDWLPPGDPWYFLVGAVFDTGSTVVLVNNSAAPGYPSDANILDLCNTTGDCPQLPPTVVPDPAYPSDGDRDGVNDAVDNCPVTPNTDQADSDSDGHGDACDIPTLPNELLVELWGLASYVDGNGIYVTHRAEVPSIHVRPNPQPLVPTLIGAPVAARVIASIDYATTVTRQFPFGTRTAPDMWFYVPGGANTPPVAPYQVRLERRGSFGEALIDQASTGPRFMVKNVALTNGSQVVDDTVFSVLYDTGSTTTVVTEEVARALGIDPDVDAPVDVFRVRTVGGEADVLGYVIDRFGITTREGLNEYRIDHPMIYVQRNRDDGSPPFPEGIDIVLGSNYFAWTRVLFDGPGDTLGLWEAVSLDPDGDLRADAWDNCPTVYNPEQDDNDLDHLGNACDPDDDNDGVLDPADNCPLHENPDQLNSDTDTLGDACDPDDDGDGALDTADNCPLLANANQLNTDGDALGDACDPDDDNDGVPDVADNCPFRANPGQEDVDGDGRGNACDLDNDNDGIPDNLDNCVLAFNPDQVDYDGDGYGDVCDLTPGGDAWPADEQAATAVRPGTDTTLATPDGTLEVEVPAGAITLPHTLSLLPGEDGFQVVGLVGEGASASLQVLEAYDVRVGDSVTYPLAGGKVAVLTFTIPATPEADGAFATQTLAIASKEDTDADGVEDTFVVIPDCASGEKTADGRCTTVTAVVSGGSVGEYVLAAPVTHFSTYAVTATEVCTAAARFDPKTFLRSSAGPWVTVYLELAGCSFGPSGVDVATVRLRAATPAPSPWVPVAPGAPFAVGDKDGNGVPDLMVKFEWSTVASWFTKPCEARFAVRGNSAADATLLRGTTGPVRVR